MDRNRWAGSPAVPLAEVARRLGVPLTDDVRRAARRFPLRFPAHYLGLVDPEDPADPIRRLGWPDPAELEVDADAILDPVGEGALRVHPLVIRKYRDRVVLLVTSRCHFYCRFCFRAAERSEPGPQELDAAIRAIARIGEIREVVLSGGDPLVLPDDALASIVERVSRVPQLRTVRLHTRAPVHDPARVTPELARALASASAVPLWIAIHASHPRELTPELDRAILRLLAAGIPLLAQSVLLRGVNAEAATLAELFGGLYARRVAPHYLHHPDRVAGTAHFRVAIEDGRRIYRELRGLLPGPATPQYVIDLPDGSGKVPVDWLEPEGPRLWTVRVPGRPHVSYRETGEIDPDRSERVTRELP